MLSALAHLTQGKKASLIQDCWQHWPTPGQQEELWTLKCCVRHPEETEWHRGLGQIEGSLSHRLSAWQCEFMGWHPQKGITQPIVQWVWPAHLLCYSWKGLCTDGRICERMLLQMCSACVFVSCRSSTEYMGLQRDVCRNELYSGRKIPRNTHTQKKQPMNFNKILFLPQNPYRSPVLLCFLFWLSFYLMRCWILYNQLTRQSHCCILE